MKTNLFAAAATASLLATGGAQAAGFSIDTHGARATGMGTAVTAHVDDASASYYNPAGLLGGTGPFELQLGDTLVAPNLSFSRDGGSVTSQPRGISPPPHAFAAGLFGDRFAWGVGFFTPYGAKSQWPEAWEGNQRALRSAMSIYALNPSLAIRLHPRLRLGAGLQLVRGTVEIARALQFPGSTGTLQLGGAGNGLGANIGVQAELVQDVLSFGASYRSEVGLTFEGVADFDGVPAEFDGRLKDQKVKAPVTLPGLASMGLSFKPAKRLTVAFDANYQQWSAFRELRIEFTDPSLTSPAVKYWRNTWNYHLGAEWGVTDALALRGGLVYDPSPSPSGTLTPDLPDADRLKATAGVGYAFGQWRADLGYQYVRLLSKRSNAPGFSGSYDGDAHVAGVTVGFKL